MTVLKADIHFAGYEEKKPVIRDIGFEVGAGELVGLIGPNGAGKSTTIKTILGLLRHMEGKVQVLGDNGRYAYVPEQPVLYEYMTLWEHLELAASAYELNGPQLAERAEALLRRFRLSDARDQYPVKFSKGMQQKTMLIIGFMLEPDVYIVDEPFVGLDPRATRDFLELLESERKRGAGILMSTHVLDTAERICSRFVLVNAGTVVATGTLDEVREQAGLAPDASLFDCFDALT
ncbi:multidrug ABC transporter ATP-binding protein [Paenibacillus cisolokensis]|uniref:Multidrug ABC transporter ATP-binding protein n=1 Tax=Paenibacillus cisolokensis TaxID=1658519 RepID=A0ABQ4N6H1_9BACL|nr:ABC transporter ATP-binding protein [Paenibacillus cisolokensis]GIQ63764.1 multidrug ABC transporter ATP-binding protein [Paenibacillus cisolokensis]